MKALLLARNEQPPKPSWWEVWGSKSLTSVTTLATLATLVVLAVQAQAALDASRSSAEQAESAVAALAAQTRSDDLAFLTGVTISPGSEGFSIVNGTQFPMTSAAFWYLQQDDGRLQEVEGAVAGIVACSSLSVPWSFLEEAKPSSASSDGEVGDRFFRGLADRQELSLAIQAPSGSWYVKGSSGSLYSISIDSVGEAERSTSLPQERWPGKDPIAIVASPFESGEIALKALHDSAIYEAAPDTYWEGAETVDQFITTTVVGPGDEITRGFSTPGVTSVLLRCE